MPKYLRKKIFLTTTHSKFCWVRVYFNADDMREAYRNLCQDKNIIITLNGAHLAYIIYNYRKGAKKELSCETGLVFLHVNKCGAGVVSHEFGHAVLWAHKHPEEKYPLVIDSIEEEEAILHNQTYAVIQFYQWFYKIKPQTNMTSACG